MMSASVCTQPLAGRPWAAPAGVSARRAAASARPRPVRVRAEATATGDSVKSQSEEVKSVGESETRPAVVILPGLGNCTEDYVDFAAELEARGRGVIEVKHSTSLLSTFARLYDEQTP